MQLEAIASRPVTGDLGEETKPPSLHPPVRELWRARRSPLSLLFSRLSNPSAAPCQTCSLQNISASSKLVHQHSRPSRSRLNPKQPARAAKLPRLLEEGPAGGVGVKVQHPGLAQAADPLQARQSWDGCWDGRAPCVKKPETQSVSYPTPNLKLCRRSSLAPLKFSLSPQVPRWKGRGGANTVAPIPAPRTAEKTSLARLALPSGSCWISSKVLFLRGASLFCAGLGQGHGQGGEEGVGGHQSPPWLRRHPWRYTGKAVCESFMSLLGQPGKSPGLEHGQSPGKGSARAGVAWEGQSPEGGRFWPPRLRFW